MLTTLAALTIACAQPDPLDQYNIVWTTPSKNAAGSMPIGNGVVGANVWVEEGGDLCFYISRTDAWSECDRLLKLGKVRVSLSPNPFEKGKSFKQTLILREGRIEIVAGEADKETTIEFYIDSTTSDIHVNGTSKQGVAITATLERWRTDKKTFENDDDLRSAWTMHSAPPEVRHEIVWESPDIVMPRRASERGAEPNDPASREAGLNLPETITWYHRNEHSIVPFTLAHQGLKSIAGAFPDPLLYRTFGGVIRSDLSAVPDRADQLASRGPAANFRLDISTLSSQSTQLSDWLSGLLAQTVIDDMTDGANASAKGEKTLSPRERHLSFWRDFWDRSYIFVDNDAASPGSFAVPANNHPLRIGADSGGGNKLRGAFDCLEIHETPLSSAQIAVAHDHPLSEFDQVPTQGESPFEARPAAFPKPWAAWNGKSLTSLKLTADALARTLSAVGAARIASPAPDHSVLECRDGSFELPAADAPDFSHGFTLIASFTNDPNHGPARIFDKLTAGQNNGFLFDTHPGNALRLIVGERMLQVPDALKGQGSHTVAATYDAATGAMAIYLDGKLLKESQGNSNTYNDPAPPSRVTQSYILQRFISACGSGPGSQFPIKFNGSIFTVEPAFTEGQPHNPDWRKWGGCFWWQNTRLPYYPMLAAGDFDRMDSLFSFYERAVPGAEVRAKLYHNAEGVYFPETMTTFGAYSNGDYGWNRKGVDSNIIQCPWWQWAWQQNLELTQIMLDYAAYTGDRDFLTKRALPMAHGTLKYYDTRFKRDDKGKLRITPTQAAETYWHDVVNDAPTVGGLIAVCDMLLALPADAAPDAERAFWKSMRDACPTLPMRTVDGKTVAAPAESYKDQRNNVETPELYPCWPFRLYGVGKPNLEAAVQAWRNRHDKANRGWTQDGILAAMLGLTNDAKADLLARCANSHKNFRFPAMWGPNFDWLPDQCHGGNLQSLLQLMLMQCDADQIRLLPAWPKDWNVSFKLHAPKQTIIECDYRNGKIERLVVTPESRRKDIIMP